MRQLSLQGDESKILALCTVTDRFATQFEKQKKSLSKYQNTAADVGLVDALCSHFMTSLSVVEQDLALHAIKWVCLDNKVRVLKNIFIDCSVYSRVFFIIKN
jgi:hypothetical protein